MAFARRNKLRRLASTKSLSLTSLGLETLERRDLLSGVPELVRDINAFPGSLSSFPRDFLAAGDVLFFSAQDDTTGEGLWRSNGSEAGTVLVKDGVDPRNLVYSNSTVYFTAVDVAGGRDLWKSDGAEDGTFRVMDMDATLEVSSLTDVNGTLYFITRDRLFNHPDVDFGLWRSDGTPENTVRVTSNNIGSPASFPTIAGPQNLVNVAGTLFFTTDVNMSGRELWKSDGTEGGTVRVKDINPGSASSSPNRLVAFNGNLFFTASDGVSGVELWKSDGTEEGTVRVKDINPGSAHSIPSSLVDVDGTLFFSASDGISGSELWKSDGTEEGTVRVKAINPGSASSSATNLTNVDGTLFFAANDGISGPELWKSDGTDEGTVRVTDIFPEDVSLVVVSPFPSFVGVNGLLFFAADDGIRGRELWKSDGSQTGTLLVKDIRTGGASSSPTMLTSVGESLAFVADDGIHGAELWTSDGTSLGTNLVKELSPGDVSSVIHELRTARRITSLVLSA